MHKERMIPIGYVTEAYLIAWGESHANFQKALAREGVEEHIQALLKELLAWSNETGMRSEILERYIGKTEKDFAGQARNYLLRMFVEAIAKGVIFEGKSIAQVERETICSQDWIYQTIHEGVEEVKRDAQIDMIRLERMNLAIAITLENQRLILRGKCSLRESNNNGSDENDGECVRRPYSNDL